MLPSVNDGLEADFTEEELPNKTYRVDWEKGTIHGMCDDLQAVEQAIYKILGTERYENLIYSWNYGAELQNLLGQPAPYVYSEIKRLVTEALTQDDRIESVNNFTFEKQRGKVHVTFTVTTKYGVLEVTTDV